MSESSNRKSPASKTSKEQSCKFGTIVLALWPEKPALNLSQRIGCTERAANLYINGRRKISARAAYVIFGEILSA